MKKVGIVCDNYKVPKFREELNKAGFNDIAESSVTMHSKLLKIQTPADRIPDVKRICQLLELHFKHSN